MEAILLNTKFESVMIFDTYKSFIWTDRYDEAGDFELCLPMDIELFDYIKKGYYLWNPDSEHVMVIETITIESDDEEGFNLIVSGRSIESILDRRIVWRQNSENKLVKTIFTMDVDTGEEYNLQDAVEILLNENVINPSIEVRKIPNFIFERSYDEKVTKLTVEAQYLGESLYDIISKLCIENEIGFKITLNEDNQFVFQLYAGVDRSYEQVNNPYVIFSPEFDNVMSTNYIDSVKTWKNVTLVAGEEKSDGESSTDTIRDIYVEGFASGIERREIFTDANNITSSVDGGTLTADQYYAQLRKSGIDTLIDNAYINAFEGEVDPNRMYVYGVDYYIGDIVQVANEYGQEGQAYISEFIMSSDENGTTAYPTFKSIEKGVYET